MTEAAIPIDPDHARFEIDVEGHRLQLEVVRQRRWEVRYRRDNGTPAEPGANLPTFTKHAVIREEEDDNGGLVATLHFTPLTFPIGSKSLPIDKLEFAGLCTDWKVDRIERIAMPVDQ